MVQAPRKAVEEPRLEVNMQTLMTARPPTNSS